MKTPEMTIMGEVCDKLMFLLELNQSVDLSAQILESEGDANLVGRLKSSKDMNMPKSIDGKSIDQTSEGDITLQRSKSAIAKPSEFGSKGLKRIKSKRNVKISKFHAIGKKSKQPKSENVSSTFESVSAFIKEIDVNFCRLPNFDMDSPSENNEDSKSETQNSNEISVAKQKLKSKILENTFKIADNRILGLEYYNKLLRTITQTNQCRSIVSSLALGVGENPFISIEASGIERLRKINSKIQDTLRLCFGLFIRDYTRLKYTVEELIKYKQAAVTTNLNKKAYKSTTADELIVASQIRSIIESLNDIIIILSNNPAKEAFILHVVFELNKSSVDFGVFISHLIGLILDAKDSLILYSDTLISQTQIAARLLLNKFIIKETEESQLSNDAHLLLQETMLEIIIGLLKNEILST
jgi:hypothetical protein